MNNMNKSIEFDFNKFSNKLLCVKALKDIFGFGLKEAKELCEERRHFLITTNIKGIVVDNDSLPF